MTPSIKVPAARLWDNEKMAQALTTLAEDAPALMVALLQGITGYIQALFAALTAAEVEKYCGAYRCRRTGDYQRWGTNPGSIVLGSERIPVRVPRIRNVKTKKEQR